MELPRWLRAAVGVALAAWMVGGPTARQVLGVGPSWLPRWRMYHDHGVGSCAARFYAFDDDGSRTEIDRFAALGYDGPHDAPDWLRAPDSWSRIASTGRRLCGTTGSRDVRVRAWCATADGWEATAQARKNLCAPDRPTSVAGSLR